jgi:dipeptidyl aminopeptidase/acylaminoacyl peptidase
LLTARASEAPPGTAIALYQHGLNFGWGDRPQAVVLGAYDDVYRRVDLAEAADGEPIATLLSPDGTRVAVGNRNSSNVLSLVDLSTGKSEKLPAWPEPSSSLAPIAWSSDGRYLVVLRYAGEWLLDPLLYDLRTRETPTALEQGITWAAAFSPDGRRLAFQPDGNGLRVIDLNTRVTAELPVPSGMPRAVRLAWSPDGQLLAATGNDKRVHFVDATGSGRPVPVPVRFDLAFVLAWTGARTILISRNGFVEVNVDSGVSRRVSEFDESRVWPAESHELGLMSFASNLMIGVQSRPADAWPDRGPWPDWLRLATFVSIVLLAGAATLLVRRVRRRWRWG